MFSWVHLNAFVRKGFICNCVEVGEKVALIFFVPCSNQILFFYINFLSGIHDVISVMEILKEVLYEGALTVY
jgi:hypothetical protein